MIGQDHPIYQSHIFHYSYLVSVFFCISTTCGYETRYVNTKHHFVVYQSCIVVHKIYTRWNLSLSSSSCDISSWSQCCSYHFFLLFLLLMHRVSERRVVSRRRLGYLLSRSKMSMMISSSWSERNCSHLDLIWQKRIHHSGIRVRICQMYFH
jgi:hypothetical protein